LGINWINSSSFLNAMETYMDVEAQVERIKKEKEERNKRNQSQEDKKVK
jgi:hypothetical protein